MLAREGFALAGVSFVDRSVDKLPSAFLSVLILKGFCHYGVGAIIDGRDRVAGVP